MFKTTQPLGPANQAYAVVHFTPYVKDGKIQENVLFRSQRFFSIEDGTIITVGPVLDKAFTPEQLVTARKASPALDKALTELATALDALAPELGL